MKRILERSRNDVENCWQKLVKDAGCHLFEGNFLNNLNKHSSQPKICYLNNINA